MCNHCLFETCAKIGGQPWAMEEMPHFYECSMALAYHVSNDIVSMVATFNSKCTRFWSKCLSIKIPVLDEPKMK